jgi:branched-chain amino acid transport system ATP-binding protein
LNLKGFIMEILSTVGLSKHFGSVRALERVDITVQKDTIHSLIGPNGSGKSTFFNVITGFLSSTHGNVLYNGTDITNLEAHIISKLGISRTFQIPRIIPDMTCLENVMLGLHSRTKTKILETFFRLPFTFSSQEKYIKEKAYEFLEFVSLEKHANSVAADLSWMEEQLLQLARAIVGKPDILLLDEPTAGMGSAETEAIKKIIIQIRGLGTTVVLVAHDIKLVMGISDLVTVINFGHKIAEGTAEEVQRNQKVLEAYLGTE